MVGMPSSCLTGMGSVWTSGARDCDCVDGERAAKRWSGFPSGSVGGRVRGASSTRARRATEWRYAAGNAARAENRSVVEFP